jgi:hypothetical protein
MVRKSNIPDHGNTTSHAPTRLRISVGQDVYHSSGTYPGPEEKYSSELHRR